MDWQEYNYRKKQNELERKLNSIHSVLLFVAAALCVIVALLVYKFHEQPHNQTAQIPTPSQKQPAPTQPAATQPIINGGYIALPNVQYPSQSQDEGEAGSVLISFIVETDGSVSDVIVKKSSGYERLDNAVIRAAWRAKYRPKIIDGIPVRTRFNSSYDFMLE